jgi:IS30 family transposase
MFPKLITKYKKQPLLLDNFLTFFSNLCSGESVLKTSLTKDKVAIIFDSLYHFVLNHKSKNR